MYKSIHVPLCEPKLGSKLQFSILKAKGVMYYLSMAAYSIFFNASRVLYILFPLLLVSIYVFLVLERKKHFHALACNQEGMNLVYLQFQEAVAYSNASNHKYFRNRAW